jgi:Glycosyl transferase family 2
MRIIGHMVTRNEMGRWLTTTLPWLAELCHGDVAVYDDQSTDETAKYAADLVAAFRIRPDAIPSFAENEGVFRWAAWQFMERRLAARDGDWVLVVDADELLLTNIAGGDADQVRMQLMDAIGRAEEDGHRTLTFNVAEVFEFDGMGWPLVRTDGFWGTITACRAAHWQCQGVFGARKEGGGSLPSSWRRNPRPDEHLELLHLGYARPEDRVEKHRRYSQGSGHSSRHVKSILDRPHLTHWVGMRPPLQV